MFNFQDPIHKTDFGTSHGRTVFHLLKELVGNQYLKVLRILVPPEILVPRKILHNLRVTPYVQLNIFPDPIHQKSFSIYDPVTICNFTEKLPQNKYICLRSKNISSVLDITCPFPFWKVLKILLNDNYLIFKIPYNRLIWTVIISKHSR